MGYERKNALHYTFCTVRSNNTTSSLFLLKDIRNDGPGSHPSTVQCSVCFLYHRLFCFAYMSSMMLAYKD